MVRRHAGETGGVDQYIAATKIALDGRRDLTNQIALQHGVSKHGNADRAMPGARQDAAAPMPPLAPVTTTTLFFKSISTPLTR